MDGGLSSLLIVGGNSMIGRAVAAACAARNVAVAVTTRPQLDLAADPARWPALPRVDAAILCAAVTATAECERDPAASRRVNVDATVALARRLHADGTRVVLPSTNMVFDGSVADVPTETPPAPTSEYGRQKADAERGILALGDRAAVLRLGKVLAPGIALFDGWLADLRAGRAIAPFEDMVLAPIAADLAARAVLAIAESGDGIYQLTAARDVSYADLARRIAARIGAPDRLVESVRGRAPTTAPRHTTLAGTRLLAEYRIAPPEPDDAVAFLCGKQRTQQAQPTIGNS